MVDLLNTNMSVEHQHLCKLYMYGVVTVKTWFSCVFAHLPGVRTKEDLLAGPEARRGCAERCKSGAPQRVLRFLAKS